MRQYLTAILAVLLVTVAGACTQSEPTLTSTPVPIQTSVPSSISTPTATPIPTTAAIPTPSPVPTPNATSTPSDTSDSTVAETQEDIEATINGILAELLNDAILDLRDLEAEVEADIALLADDDQALIGTGQ